MSAEAKNTDVLSPTLGKGWGFPIAQHDGPGSALSAARDEDVVRQSIWLILSTAKGERVMRPDFGCDLGRLVFHANNGATRALAAFEVSDALKTWEPRIDVLSVDAAATSDEPETILIDVAYRLRSTDSRFNLVYPFYLDRSLA